MKFQWPAKLLRLREFRESEKKKSKYTYFCANIIMSLMWVLECSNFYLELLVVRLLFYPITLSLQHFPKKFVGLGVY